MKPRRKPVRRRRPTRSQLVDEVQRRRQELEDHQDQWAAVAMADARGELEQSRERYVDLYDFGPVGYLTLDRFGIIRSVNMTAAEMLGHSRKKLVGTPLFAMVVVADRRRFLGHLSHLKRGQERSTVEFDVLRPGQAPLAVQLVSVVRGGGPPHAVEFRTALVDISERKRAEAHTAALARLGLKLSAATDPAAAARAVVDTAQQYCGWDACFFLLHDPATDTVTDLVTIDTIKGERVPVLPLPAGRPVTPMVRKVMEEGPELVLRQSAQRQGPLTSRFGDTTRVSLSLMFVPIRLEGKSIGVLSIQSYQPNAYSGEDLATLQGLADHAAVALARLQAEAELRRANERLEARVAERTAELRQYRDHLEELVKQRTSELEAANAHLRQEITQRQAAEEAVVRRSEELKRSNLDLEQFAYVASHDLQEPLRAVGGFVRLLEHRFNQKLDDKGREFIQGAVEGANRMEQLILDLLALSRVSTTPHEVALTDLGTPLDAALQNLQFTIRAANAKVTHDPLPKVRVDERQIFQLFQNLIANALKFRNEAPPHIHVGAQAEGKRWVFSVRDNGIGIEPQYFARIFQVFQRLHTRKKYPGTGIGLAVCKKIVERHGGSMWVESEPGKGSTFFFSLAAENGME
jgi:PAS domain S-box-containing protein